MPAPLDPATATAIEQALRDAAGDASCRGIARQYNVSPGTVRNIAKRAGLDGAFERRNTAAATKARQVDMADRRAAFAEVLLAKAEHIARRLDSAYVVVVTTKDDVFRETLDEPPLREVKDGMAAVGVALKGHMDLIRFDTQAGSNPEAPSLLSAVAAGLDSAYEAITGRPPGPPRPAVPAGDAEDGD